MRLHVKRFIIITTLFTFVPFQIVHAQNFYVYKTQACDNLGNISLRIQNQFSSKIWGPEGLVAELVKYNNLKDKNNLSADQEIKIPADWIQSSENVKGDKVNLPPYIFKNISPYIVANCQFDESQKQATQKQRPVSNPQPVVVNSTATVAPVKLKTKSAMTERPVAQVERVLVEPTESFHQPVTQQKRKVTSTSPAAAECATPEHLTKPDPLRSPAQEEDRGFIPNSIFGIKIAPSVNRIYALDNNTGVEATFVSKNHMHFALEWEQIWSSSLSTYAHIGQRSENYADSDGPSSLQNRSTTRLDMKIGASYILAEKNKFSLALGTNSITYFKGNTAPNGVRIIAVPANQMQVRYQRQVLNYRPFQIWLGGEYNQFSGANMDDIKLDSVASWGLTGQLSQGTKFGFIDLNIGYYEEKMRSQFVNSKRKDIELGFGLRFKFGD